jgi:hypothetical protein
VQTRARRSIGAAVCLDHFVVEDPGAEPQLAAIPKIEAIVDRVSPHGLALRFTSTPEQAAALARLTRRERYEA